MMLFGIYLFAIFLLSLFGIHKFYLVYLFWKYGNIQPENPEPPETWPHVTVQLPVYNERFVLKRLLKAVSRIDYPKERLSIQVLDDSTDGTSRIAAQMVSVLRRQGIDIHHLRRGTREGFKAGALDFGMSKTDAGILAVFDADFVPAPDFLKQTVPYLLSPGIGMVQTRWGHINRDYSLLTRLEAIFLDGHFLIEQLARNRSGRFFNFNGTAGIWRRRAIEDAGGWEHDTLTEDLDLSYRAQLAGWKFLFLPDVVSPAEIPVQMSAFKTQQHRWAKGSVQTGIKLLPRIIMSRLPFPVKLEAMVHLTQNLVWIFMMVPIFFMIPIMKQHMKTDYPYVELVYIGAFLCATVSIMVYYSAAIYRERRKLFPDFLFLPAMMALGVGLSLNNSLAAFEALVGYRTPFLRTPKHGIKTKKDRLKSRLYLSKTAGIVWVEFFLAVYFSYGVFYFLFNGMFFHLPFLVLFQTGFFYTSLPSMNWPRIGFR